MIVRDRTTSFPSPKRKRGVLSRCSVGVPERRPACSAGVLSSVQYDPHRQQAGGTGGFTLVEMLVVIVVIVILMSAVLAASSTLINKARRSSTQALLTVVRDAVEQFKREQTARPTIARVDAYRERYGFFPPDELEVFTDIGIPGGPAGSRAPGRAVMFPEPSTSTGYEPMKFYTKGLPPDKQAVEHRDLAAMIVAIQTLGDASSTILDRIQNRYWMPGPLDTDGNPAQFLDRPDPATGVPDGEWDSGDHQIRYIRDDWGNPLSYFAQRDWVQPPNIPQKSSNHGDWNEASSTLIRLNSGQPVIMSYGANGKEQLTEDHMKAEGNVSIVGDFAGLGSTQGKIDHPLNADNIYADPTLKEKLAGGI